MNVIGEPVDNLGPIACEKEAHSSPRARFR